MAQARVWRYKAELFMGVAFGLVFLEGVTCSVKVIRMSLEGEISDAISRHFRTHQRVSSFNRQW